MTPLAARPQRYGATDATSASIGEESAGKKLARFGAASVRRPVSEGIAKAMEAGQ